jgi:hypothetical protein
MLAESRTITDEPDEPEPMEIARDAMRTHPPSPERPQSVPGEFLCDVPGERAAERRRSSR